MVKNNSNNDSDLSDGDLYVHYNEGESFGKELDNCYNNNAYWMYQITNVYNNVHHAQMLPNEKSSKVPRIYIGAKYLIRIENNVVDEPGTKEIPTLDRTHFFVTEEHVAQQFVYSLEESGLQVMMNMIYAMPSKPFNDPTNMFWKKMARIKH